MAKGVLGESQDDFNIDRELKSKLLKLVPQKYRDMLLYYYL